MKPIPETKSCNLTIMVSDVEESARFYSEIPGMQLTNRYGDHQAETKGPGICTDLHPTGHTITTGENLQIGLRVDDLENAMSELKTNGIDCKRHDGEKVDITFFHDLDGNTPYFAKQRWGTSFCP